MSTPSPPSQWNGHSPGVPLIFLPNIWPKSPRRTKSLAQEADTFDDALVIRARHQNQAVAGLLVLAHGNNATYQIGWTSEAGRPVNATNLCLWTAVEHLKERGLSRFDLGGVHHTSPGLVKFKQGLGGAPLNLVGVYT